ncbi:MAG: fdhD-2 [Proteobacteria bacterium]|nr:fdhD-2 [Pseudomonadota bacterium]
MFDCPNFLMIGSAGRNVGKTEFACRVIAKWSAFMPVVAVKISIENDAPVPYCLSEEAVTDSGKDTARMRQAGAAKVFWLKVRAEHLPEGLAALQSVLPVGAAVVCESTSARQWIQPGVFLVLRKAGDDAMKASCHQLIGLADRVIKFHGNGWDFQPEQCHFAQGRWFIPFAASAAILAGGQSRRMGQDKSLLPIAGQPMIAHIAEALQPLFPELMVSSNSPQQHAFLGLPLVADREAGQGPLRGILSCLEVAKNDLLLVTACDIPQLPLAFMGDMLHLAQDCDLVIPVSAEGRHEPLFAVYRKTLIPAARQILAAGGRRIVELFVGHRSACPELPQGLFNLNTPDEYQRFAEKST